MHGTFTAAILIFIVIGAVVLTASGIWWLAPLASNWGDIDMALLVTLAVIGFAFVVLNLFLAYVVWRYRHRDDGSRATFLPDDPHLEKWLIGITAIGIVVLLAPGLFVYSRYISPPQDAIVVEVVGEQWRWTYRYPGPDGKLGRTDPKLISAKNLFGVDHNDPASHDDLISLRELHLPVNKPVVLEFRAKDVIHNFYVPQFRAKIDAVPGMVTRYWFTPTVMGQYQAVCAELCGIGHHKMQGTVIVEELANFEQWLVKQPLVTTTIKP